MQQKFNRRNNVRTDKNLDDNQALNKIQIRKE